MSIETLFRVQCDKCERYLGCSRPAVTDSNASPLFLTAASASKAAREHGWKVDRWCPDCALKADDSFFRNAWVVKRMAEPWS